MKRATSCGPTTVCASSLHVVAAVRIRVILADPDAVVYVCRLSRVFQGFWMCTSLKEESLVQTDGSSNNLRWTLHPYVTLFVVRSGRIKERDIIYLSS